MFSPGQTNFFQVLLYRVIRIRFFYFRFARFASRYTACFGSLQSSRRHMQDLIILNIISLTTVSFILTKLYIICTKQRLHLNFNTVLLWLYANKNITSTKWKWHKDNPDLLISSSVSQSDSRPRSSANGSQSVTKQHSSIRKICRPQTKCKETFIQCQISAKGSQITNA